MNSQAEVLLSLVSRFKTGDSEFDVSYGLDGGIGAADGAGNAGYGLDGDGDGIIGEDAHAAGAASGSGVEAFEVASAAEAMEERASDAGAASEVFAEESPAPEELPDSGSVGVGIPGMGSEMKGVFGELAATDDGTGEGIAELAAIDGVGSAEGVSDAPPSPRPNSDDGHEVFGMASVVKAMNANLSAEEQKFSAPPAEVPFPDGLKTEAEARGETWVDDESKY
jgi:hypothetical protein